MKDSKRFGVVAIGACFLGLLLAASNPASALDPAVKCESTKVKEAAKKAKCVAVVSAKSIKKNEAPDSAKLTKCSDKFGEKFVKAETKAEGACPTNGDAGTIEGLVDGCVNDVITALGGAPQGDFDEVKCQSKKAKEAGKYEMCKLKASSKAIKKGESPDFTKCNDKLSLKWGKIEAKPPCLTTGDLSTVQAALDACHVDVTQSLTGDPLCGNGTLNSGEQCDDGNLVNGDGCSDVCTFEPLVEYQQDFETLVQADTAALANDDWKVFGNVFDPTGTIYYYGYGPFPAPNNSPPGPAFCLIADSQGGPPQGAQQLVVFSDYNSGEHGAGNRIESNVFRERTIVAGDVGRTLTFQFEAKLGDIAGASTALAFIKTLDPGFNLVDFVTVDMTAIPTTWGTYSLSLDIDAPRVGFTLQYGFANTASNYEPSGIFYDNVAVSTLPTTP